MGLPGHWRHYLVCALGLAAGLAGYRAQWQYGALPAAAAPATLAYPVTVEGYTAADPERLRFLAESWPPGTTLTLVDAAADAHQVTLVLRQGHAALVLTGLGGLVFLATALFVFAPRRGQPGAAGFLWITVLYGTAILVGGVYFPRTGLLPVGAFGLIQLACLAALPVVFLGMALAFPRPSPVLARRRWLLPACAAGAAAAFAWQAVVFLRYFTDPTVANGARLQPALVAADAFMVVLTAAGVVIFAVRGRRLDLTRERNQVRWLLWGFAIGAAPYVFLRSVPELLGMRPLLPDQVDRVVELAIPVAFAGAVVRHRLLDIDVIIRRSLLYGLLAAALLAVYLVAGVVFGRWLGSPPGLPAWLPPVLLGMGAGVAFLPLRRLLGRWIDRTFFKLAHDHDRRLARLDRDLAAAASPAWVASVLGRCVAAALQPERWAVAVRAGDDVLVEGTVAAVPVRGWLRQAPAGRADLAAAPRSTTVPEHESAAFPAALADAGVVLIQPLGDGAGPAGAVLVGPRHTERRYVEQDLVFLRGCAGTAARHLERITLMQAVAAEALARERLTELDRLKSEFLAQVAHDLRTPVAGIAWSARNLLDGIVGDLAPDQADYVRTIVSSGEHLGRLVDNLLEISRLERARLELELGPVDPFDAWAEAAATVRPMAEAKGAAIEVRDEAGAPAVTANRGKLLEVAVNLLDNAVKYTAAGTSVTVTLAAVEGGALPVHVRDRGPGLRGQEPAALFARFAQGEPSPHSTRKGFGLGLHIAASYLELMGGALAAEDHPDGGAVFTCRLPLAGPAAVPTQGGGTHARVHPDRR